MYKEISHFFPSGRKSLISPGVLTWSSENMVTIWTLRTCSKISQRNSGSYSANILVKYLPIPHFPFPSGKPRSTVKPASEGKMVI